MHNQQKTEKHEKPEKNHKHEPLLLFLCFLASSIIGYLLTHQVALLSA
jgi:hypothetical protein